MHAVFFALLLVVQGFDLCEPNFEADFVIVGGGAGGSVALSKCVAAGHRCLLLERGTDYNDPFAPIPSQNVVSYFTGPATYTTSTPLRNVYNKTITFQEPNILGGSTTINAMVSLFTDIDNYYREINVSGWSYEEMLPHYLAVTKSNNRPHSNGPVEVTNTSVNDPVYLAFKAAVTSVFPNIPERIPDMNTASLTSNFSGYGPPEFTVKTFPTPVGNVGVRSSGYVSYVQPIRNHPRVRILTSATVERLTFQGGNTKTKAVIVKRGAETCEVSAKQGVILSAGALRTPQILLRSGVGPVEELQALGIPLARNIPDVGRHLDDHPSIATQHVGAQHATLYSANLEGHAYWNHQDDPALINDWTLQIVGFLPTAAIPPGFKSALTQLMNQKSRGSVKLQGSGDIAIDLGYFNDAADFSPAGLGLEKSIAVTNALGYFSVTPVICPPFLPHCLSNSSAFYQAAFLQYGSAGYHFTGTCALGKVVNPANGKVYGFKDLYVVDASILPKAPRGNTQLSVYALAEKLSATIF